MPPLSTRKMLPTIILLLCGITNNHVTSFTSPATTSLLRPLRNSGGTKLQTSFFDNIFKQKTPSSSKTTPTVSAPLDFVPPEPRPLTITRTTSIPSLLKSTLALALRLGTGTFVLGWKIDSIFYDHNDGSPPRYSLTIGPFSIRDSSSCIVPRSSLPPLKPLVLYEYDASPYCKRVRETINMLDLNVEYRPCPSARYGFSDELFALTGRRTVPYLIDPNTDAAMFESGDIIDYLIETYAGDNYDRKAFWTVTSEPFAVGTATAVALLRGMPSSTRQANARPDNERMIPLELWGYETSPFVREVREKLGSLCLPHVMVSCARGSGNRDVMMGLKGRFQVPYLVDSNTGIEMFESEEIVDYLESVYTV